MPLTHIINTSLKTGEFPERLKIAKIIPIHKKKERDIIENYRPICILPIMAKVFEKIFLKRFKDFIDQENILPDTQYGFRNKCSTKDGIFDALLYIENNKENKQSSTAILKDLSQAFDTCSHKKLLFKCSHFGIRGIPLLWIESYLSKRFFYTKIDDTCSEKEQIENGVPQGGILSPVLFNVYVADYCHAITDKTIQFADDTSDIIYSESIHDMTNKLIQNYKTAKLYFEDLNLKLNTAKTEIVNFSRNDLPSIDLQGERITPSDKARFLGIVIDRKLTFKPHIETIIRKLNAQIPTVFYIRQYLNLESKYLYYFAYIHCHIVYSAWFIQKAKHKDILLLEIAHKRLIKILFMKPKRTPTMTLFSELNLLSIRNIIYLECCCQAHRIFYKQSPTTLQQYFERSNYSNRFLLRHSNDANCTANNFAIIFNQLPNETRGTRSKSLFKSMIRKAVQLR